jgi:hypothetical protein
MADRELTRGIRIGVLLLVIVGALTAIYAGYRTYTDRYTVTTEGRDGPAVARIVETTFAGASDLKVSTLKGTVQSVGTNKGMFAWLDSSYVMKAPFSAGYYVDLSAMRPSDFRWDETTKRLTVRAPDVRVDDINVDESRIYIEDTKGVFVTRTMMGTMRRQASAGADHVAAVEARKPERIAAARRNARAALSTLLAAPLRAGGLGDVTVEVTFAGETRSTERWDTSRSLQDVLGNGS